MRIIGLTGGIACGKSTVARLLKEQHGAKRIDTDKIAHELMQPKQPLFGLYVAHFGENILTPYGNIDRKALGRVVFENPAERAWLDQTAHPQIKKETKKRLRALARQDTRLVVLEVPLLFEAGWEDMADEIWVASLPENVELQRLMERDGLMEQEARARLAAQMPLAEKMRRADYVLDNSGTLEELARAIDRGLTRKKTEET